MCGITGWLDWTQDMSESGPVIDRMVDTLTPRGPDTRGKWLYPEIALGHSRLAVVDIEGGKQPMTRWRGGWAYTITYNGELYNTEEIRQALSAKGYSFQGHSDTEVLLLSYLEWGVDCVQKLNGIFAFGIWDCREKSLFLARDRMGVKPLFYYHKYPSFIFASELKALLAHPDIPAVIDREGLAELFMIAPARTPGFGVIKNICELKPGYAMLVKYEGIRQWPYWRLENKPHTDDIRTTVDHVRELVIDAISRQLVSDVPLGTLLSGGLDSSIITAIAAKKYQAEGKILPTFSIDYIANDKYFQANDYQPDPDAPWVRKMANCFNTNHHNLFLDTAELVEALTDAAAARDLPGMADVDSSLLLFSRRIKESVTVGLSGECADEVFGGYPWFHRDDLKNADTFPWSTDLQTRLQILSPEILQIIAPLDYVRERYREAVSEVPVSGTGDAKVDKDKRISYLTLTRFMPTLLDRKDRMTMASGLEVRVPFCDHRIVEYVWNIPWEMKYWQNREKGLLRTALEGILPEDVLWRRKSPYPKTHHPQFLEMVTGRLRTVLEDSASPLYDLVNKKQLLDLMANPSSDANRPWFGQLMDTPRLFAFLLQLDFWFKKYKISII
ncbi:asparagine synthase (glutamine-hydrolyzing) [Dehalobacter restrictus]|uniref:asparagine synthase (glutamine-hydrolyzing) n=1 Tax=Dehalobacter restrictus (strain DSM 9455 / PER-K23) TaxID=871738 RepID=A0ABM5P5H0_DEHRP|nr:asparagine synthase (glutamine-hydrolyzing) [Dehalobacter restrictus]AHF09855.1 asparagine synthase [Dehalobacter restrictus DSM 9455]